MHLTQLRAFHLVARAGSFSLAARTGSVSQPTLSAQVKALEASYSVGLFDRKGRGVRLTPIGQSLYAAMEVGKASLPSLVSSRREAERPLMSRAGTMHVDSHPMRARRLRHRSA